MDSSPASTNLSVGGICLPHFPGMILIAARQGNITAKMSTRTEVFNFVFWFLNF